MVTWWLGWTFLTVPWPSWPYSMFLMLLMQWWHEKAIISEAKQLSEVLLVVMDWCLVALLLLYCELGLFFLAYDETFASWPYLMIFNLWDTGHSLKLIPPFGHIKHLYIFSWMSSNHAKHPCPIQLLSTKDDLMAGLDVSHGFMAFMSFNLWTLSSYVPYAPSYKITWKGNLIWGNTLLFLLHFS